MTAQVYILDDDLDCVSAICNLLTAINFPTKGYQDTQAFMNDCYPGMTGCLLLDVSMPGISGLEVQDRLAAQQISLPIIFITGHGDIPMSVRAIKKGAFDFLVKPFDPQELINLVGLAVYYSQARSLECEFSAKILEAVDTLTHRERAVFKGMIAGKISKVIADELCISLKTVHYYRPRVMEKLNAKTLPDLVRKAELYQRFKVL